MREQSFNKISGDDAYVDPPVPIPNTVVKHVEAESTWLETAWEDRKLPVDKDVYFEVHVLLLFRKTYALSDQGTWDSQGAGDEGAKRRTGPCESAKQALESIKALVSMKCQ